MPSDRGPLVSVITPTKDCARFLPETIESVLSQTHQNIEYLVLDDGSTDNTQSVLDPYRSRVEVVRHDNMGESRTVNKAFAWARGDYVVVVNADDPVRPELLERSLEYLEHCPELVAVYPDWWVIDDASRLLYHNPALDWSYQKMVRIWGCIPGPGAVFRRSVLDRLQGRDTRYRYVADFEFWLRMGLLGQLARIPEPLATHRTHSHSAGVALKTRVGEEILALYLDFFARENIPEYIRRLRAAAFAGACREAAARLHDFRRFRILFSSLLVAPRDTLRNTEELVYRPFRDKVQQIRGKVGAHVKRLANDAQAIKFSFSPAQSLGRARASIAHRRVRAMSRRWG